MAYERFKVFQLYGHGGEEEKDCHYESEAD